MNKLIVFDLDQTLWWCKNTWIYMSAGAPFSVVGHDRLVDVAGDPLELLPDSRRILDELQDAGYDMMIAYRSESPEWALEAMEKLGICEYFSEILVFPGSKLAHFEIIREKSGLEYSEMIFFDDELRNIEDVSSIGVKCVHVMDGVDYGTISDLLLN